MFCSSNAAFTELFSQICQQLFVENILTQLAIIEWLKKAKKSLTMEAIATSKQDQNDEYYGSEDEEDEIPIIEKEPL